MLPPPVDIRFASVPVLDEDHFPGAPCVPGSCLLEAVRRAAERAFSRPVLGVTQARFRRFVLPDQDCLLCWKEPARLPAEASESAQGGLRVGWQLREGAGPEAARLAEGEMRLGPADGEECHASEL